MENESGEHPPRKDLRDDWDRFRADPGVLPGAAPGAQRISQLAKFARAAAAYARQAMGRGGDFTRNFNMGQKNVTRDDFLEFKNVLELALKELKTSIEASSAENARLIEKGIAARSKEMEKLLQQFDAMASEVKGAVAMGARAQKTSAENANQIINLITEISLTLKQVPPSRASSFAKRLKGMMKTSFKVGEVYEQFQQYLILLGGYLLLLGVLDPKDEQKQRFFDQFLPDTSPGIYDDICHHGRELLYKDFAPELSIQMFSRTEDGLLITSYAKRTLMENVYAFQLSLGQPQMSLDFNVDTTNHVSSTVSFPGVLGPDVNPALRICYPFRDSSFNLDAFYRHAGLRANVAMHPVRDDAVVSLSGLFGSKRLNVGGLMKLDFGNVARNSCSLGCSFNTEAFSAGIQCNSHAQVLFQLSHKLEPRSLISDAIRRTTLGKDLYDLLAPTPTSQTSLGAQVIHCLSTSTSVVMVGMEYADPNTCFKVRVGNSGILSAVLKQKVFGSSWPALKSQVNLWNLGAAQRLGLSLSFGPSS